jgi:hypothetical protein
VQSLQAGRPALSLRQRSILMLHAWLGSLGCHKIPACLFAAFEEKYW